MPKFNPMDAAGAVLGGPGGIVGAIVGDVLHRQDVPMNNADVPATVAKVETAMANAGAAVVPVSDSIWKSKTVWLQIAGLISAIAAVKGINLPADQLVNIGLGAMAATGLGTVLIKKYWTKTVQKSSLPKGT